MAYRRPLALVSGGIAEVPKGDLTADGLGRNRIGLWTAQGNSTNAPHNIGIGAATATGTITSRSVATTRYYTQTRRVGYVSAATAASVSGFRLSVAQFWRGNATGLGGFTFLARFGTSDAAAVSGARMFVGLSSATAAPTDAEPNTLTDSVGLCQLSTSNNLALLTNDAAGTATTTDLGSTFPANTLSTDAYELQLYCPPNGSSVAYRVERMNTGDVATGSLTTDLPTNSTLLAVQGWRSNGAAGTLAVGIDLMSLYVETEY